MDLIDILVVLVSIVCTTWFYYLLRLRSERRSTKPLPPGPSPFPIIGNIHQLGQNPHESLAKLAKIHGPLMSVYLGTTYSLIVSSPEMARELFQKHGHNFSSRTIAVAAQAHDHHLTSMAFLPVGDQWRMLRKISQEQMFTIARLQASQALRQQKLHKLSEYIRKCQQSGKIVNIGEAAFITALNLMSATLFSIEVADFDSNDQTREFKSTFENLVRVSGSPNLSDFFPVLKPFDPQGVLRKSKVYFGKLLGFIEDLINERLESRRKGPTTKKTDVLETLLDLMEGSEYELSIVVIKHLLLDLFVGGSDTSSSTVEWAMTEVLLNPDVMSKAQHELRTVIGEKGKIEESDISRLPYLQAVIKETFRFHPPTVFILPRKSEYEVEVNGYTIPKHTQTIVSLWAIGRDPSIWQNPDSFEPERFLDSKLDFKGQHFELIPFGSGRRICPGLPLANRMVHLTVATLIHEFDWKLEIGTGPEFHQARLAGLVRRRVLPLMGIPTMHV